MILAVLGPLPLRLQLGDCRRRRMVASNTLRPLLRSRVRCQVRRIFAISAVKRRCQPCDTTTATGPVTWWVGYWPLRWAVNSYRLAGDRGRIVGILHERG